MLENVILYNYTEPFVFFEGLKENKSVMNKYK